MPIHRKLTESNIHTPHSFEYTDEADRLEDSDFVSTDLYKLAWQLDDFSYWVLIDWETPTWGPFIVE